MQNGENAEMEGNSGLKELPKTEGLLTVKELFRLKEVLHSERIQKDVSRFGMEEVWTRF